MGWPPLSFVLLAALIYLLGHTLEVLPVGKAYAVWTGVGALGTAILGILLFQESVNTIRIGSIALLVVGIAGLKLLSG